MATNHRADQGYILYIFAPAHPNRTLTAIHHHLYANAMPTHTARANIQRFKMRGERCIKVYQSHSTITTTLQT